MGVVFEGAIRGRERRAVNSRRFHSRFTRTSCAAGRLNVMNSDTSTSVVAGVRGWLQRGALVFKVFGVGLIGLVLLIPLGMVRSTLRERAERHVEAVQSITETWGGAQRVAGPVLAVPYTYTVSEGKEALGDVRVARGEAVFLPERLTIGGTVVPTVRKRGIYETPVYGTTLTVSGNFAAPSFEFLAGQGVEPQWAQARVCFGISDLRGARGDLGLVWGGETVALQPGARFGGMNSGVHALVGAAAEQGNAFNLELALNGSEGLRFLPLGRETEVMLTSAWADPSFGGAYLPAEREVGADGFRATWRVSYYGRSFPQQWTEGGAAEPSLEAMEKTSFGVNLMEPVNAYRTVERAIKYGVLFIALVFTTFFLFEAVCGLRLNALNYLLVGAALCLFYLTTLALAEFVPFGAAYTGAAAGSAGLIALYARRVLRSGGRARLVGGMLGGVYSYLYFVLQMEDFALLAGTGALFIVLAAVMYATRHLDGRETRGVGRAERGEDL